MKVELKDVGEVDIKAYDLETVHQAKDMFCNALKEGFVTLDSIPPTSIQDHLGIFALVLEQEEIIKNLHALLQEWSSGIPDDYVESVRERIRNPVYPSRDYSNPIYDE